MGEVEVHALRGVDLELYAGELLVLLGPSGSGKSTLLNILGGLDTATGGEVYYRDSNLTHADEKTLTEIATTTGGRYFRATSAQALEAIYGEIDRMEKTTASTVEYVQYNERGPWLALVAGLVLAGALVVGETAGSRIP